MKRIVYFCLIFIMITAGNDDLPGPNTGLGLGGAAAPLGASIVALQTALRDSMTNLKPKDVSWTDKFLTWYISLSSTE